MNGKSTGRKQMVAGKWISALISALITVFLFEGCGQQNHGNDALRKTISGIILGKDATIGISIIAKDGTDTLSFYGDRHFPMQSAFKMHIALAVLTEIDKGRFSIDHQIEIMPEDLLPLDLWSPLRDEHPEGGRFTIAELIRYSVSHSDNVACDALIRLIGTPKSVESCFKSQGINDISVVFNEKEMQSKWENMFQNWITPKASGEILKRYFYNKNNELSAASHTFFWNTMKETTTGPKRLKGLLPEGTVVAHKTGSSGTNEEGLTAATNDLGVIFLPDGEEVLISVFVANSHENDESNEKLIAEIAKAVYMFYGKHELNGNRQ
ncbi:MAG: class A beta-lactamase, subclass A2 [Flavobacteriales bacterium]|nr:class A beta-lactamase, subclass A2 [Flavobacteriales bacterium]